MSCCELTGNKDAFRMHEPFQWAGVGWWGWILALEIVYIGEITLKTTLKRGGGPVLDTQVADPC